MPLPIVLNKPLSLLVLLSVPLFWVMIARLSPRGLSRNRRLVLTGLRTLMVAVVVLALADPVAVTMSDRVNLFFCLDQSDSIAAKADKSAHSFMIKAVPHMGPEDRAGLIVFGDGASVEIALDRDFAPSVVRSQIQGAHTNIYAALQAAIGKLPAEGKGRIVLFSDGNQNRHDAAEMATLAASLGIEIWPVPMDTWFGSQEVYLEKIDLPASIPLETPFKLRVVINSSTTVDGELIVMKNDQLLKSRPVQLKAGKNVVQLTDSLSAQGLCLYRAIINAAVDTVFQNNEAYGFTKGTRKSSILMLTQSSDPDSEPLSRALTSQGFEVTHRLGGQLMPALHHFSGYSAIIIHNLPGERLTFGAMESIETFVRDFGGGLIMIGGDKGFGAGNWRKTPVEKALPVFMDSPTKVELPSLGLVLAIDKSSSMVGSHAKGSKLEMAKIAAFSAVEMLNPTDTVAVLGFDSAFDWVVPLTLASERQEIARQLSMMSAEGGTDLYPGLADAFRVLDRAETTKKHIIVLSDGLTKAADFKGLVTTMRKRGVTVSTVALGASSDLTLMGDIAAWGGGRRYYTDDPDRIPRIFAGETRIVTKNVISEKPLRPYRLSASEMLAGIPVDTLPQIDGHIVTYPKPRSEVIFNTDKGPLLSAWRYGLGRSVAFTSDLAGRWGYDWVNWEHYGRFVAQMVRWTMRKEALEEYIVETSVRGGRGHFMVDVIAGGRRFVNHLDLRLKLSSPSREPTVAALEQVQPGRYHGSFPIDGLGEHYLTLYQAVESDQPERPLRPAVFGLGIAYTDEFTRKNVDRRFLESLARTTTGRLLEAGPPPEELFSTEQETRVYGRHYSAPLTILFLLLLLLDVLLRKNIPFRRLLR